ncbi:TIGR03086 family metal-binding protein [Micromonospora sp. WMMA1363]|uniref:TIGR03086 family metal-binding protein n=1 Tax=Micromonospora sp. WMMA1363 TaxID=3053985 RepID=UPI00259D12ED|nr:TIGR03086 family metal-binding protein [Micromonospora sp. WMMA1363]MDM4718146.1 TIGR03086 family metal-binding protein [Micromonospora sp. WMMA1363]
MDLLETYRRSVAEFTNRVAEVAPGQWTAPTPCPDWDVRTLVNHVVGEDRWSVSLMAGHGIAEIGDRYGGDQLDGDPAAAARDAAAQAELAFTRPSALERTVDLSSGPTPADEYLRQLIAEHLVHGWDLAVSIGADPRLDADAVAECARWFHGRIGDYQRDRLVRSGMDVPAGSDAQDRLIAAFGRDPDWAP